MSVLKDTLARENSGFVQHGIAQFSTTDATFELPSKLGTILSFSLTPVGAFGANDQLSLDEAVTGEGVIKRPTTNTLTVTRNTGGTSGLKFSYVLRGIAGG